MLTKGIFLLSTISPLKTSQKVRKGEENKVEPCSPDVISSSSPKLTAKGELGNASNTSPNRSVSSICIACIIKTRYWSTFFISLFWLMPILTCFPILSSLYEDFHPCSTYLPSFWFSLFLIFPWGSDEAVTSPTSDRAAVAKKRFTLQGFSNLKTQKGNFQPIFPTITWDKCKPKILIELKSKNNFLIKTCL